MARIHIVFGSVTGTAEAVAECAQRILAQLGHEIIFHADGFDADLRDGDVILVCCATTGIGDMPQNIEDFYRFILAPTRDMSRIAYGVIALGDSSYPDFAAAGKRLDEQLQDVGAHRIGENLILDAIVVDDHEAEAGVWLRHWQTLL